MRTIRTKVYNFSELTKDAQEVAISKNADINTDYDWWEFNIEHWQEKLTEQGFYNSEIYFSGFHSQGDGACFDADIEVSKFAETQNEKRISKLIDNNWIDNFRICKSSYSNHYSHEKTRYVDYESTFKENIDSVLNDLGDKIEAKRLELSKEIYDSLYKSYCYLQSDEAIKETLIANDYEFTKEGNIF